SPALSLLRARGGFVDTFRAANPGVDGYTDDQEMDVVHATATERVDYVLVSGRTPLTDRVLSSRLVLDQPMFDEDDDVLWPSDHYAVLSEVDVFGRTAISDRASRASRAPRTPHGASRTPTG